MGKLQLHPIFDRESKLFYGFWRKGWYDVKDYELLYEVNHDVQVRNKTTGRILKPNKNDQVKLHDGKGNISEKRVYHLVLEAFFPHIPRNGRTCDHIDENHHNHQINNLQWLTPTQQNIKSHQLQPRNNGPAQSKPVEQWTLGLPNTKIATFSSVMEAERKTEISNGNISACARGKIASAGGFRWQFEKLESQKDLQGEEWKTNAILIVALQEGNRKKKPENLAKVRISNLGRILTAKGIKTKGKKQGRKSCYRMYENWQVHQLVWMVWGDGRPVPRKGDKLVIMHNDNLEPDEEGCVDNGIANLKLGTRSQNTKSWQRAKAKKRTFSKTINDAR